MPAANVTELRQLLAERFPGLRTRASELAALKRHHWPSGLPQIDEPLHGGFAQGTLTEVVAERLGAGSALLLTTILRQALDGKQFVAVIDGRDSLDVTSLGEDLSRLLWVRCHSAAEVMKAADLLLRDGNVPVVLIDLIANPAAQLRKIPATTWYRFQRLVEETSTVCLVFTPHAMVSPAQARVVLRSRFSLNALRSDREALLRDLKLEVSEARRGEAQESLSCSA